MNLDELIRGVVEPIVPVCFPGDYDGEEKEYCVYAYDERGAAFGDDTADALVYDLTLHWYLPKGENHNRKKRQLREALDEAGFTWPEIFNVSDEKEQHFVFECEIEGGVKRGKDEL